MLASLLVESRAPALRAGPALLALLCLAALLLAHSSGQGFGPPAAAATGEARRLAVPDMVLQAFALVAANAREGLALGSRDLAGPLEAWKLGSNFEAVKLSLPLAPPIVKHDPAQGDGEGDKNIVGLQLLGKGGKRCVVYGMGIAWESSFEQQMAAEGCETHAFDCTLDPASPVVAGKAFSFHNWCIGDDGSSFNADYSYLRGRSKTGLQFKKLSETMLELGHDSVDILKFDIEGFEWKLFESEICGLANPPKQLAFELHTEGAKPIAVPPHLVKGKHFREVNRLFLRLHDAGYRVVSKELNRVDEKCAEFVLVNVDTQDQ